MSRTYSTKRINQHVSIVSLTNYRPLATHSAPTFRSTYRCSHHRRSTLAPIFLSPRAFVTPSTSPKPPSASSTSTNPTFNNPTDEQITATFAKTQNGSDIRGITLDFIPEEHVTLSPYMMFFIAGAFADWLANKLNKSSSSSSSPSLKISVGADPRLSSPIISAAMTAGLAARHHNVSLVSSFGLCTTPAMFMSCIMDGHDYDGAIMITASHLPVNRNGAKFFTKDGGLDKPDIKWILQRATELYLEEKNNNNNKMAMFPPPLDPHGQGLASVLDRALLGRIPTSGNDNHCQIKEVDFLPVYAAHLRKIIVDSVNHPSTPEKPLTGFKILVNAGNGGGGFIATQVLQPLGADISGSINLEPNGYFSAHPANPEDKKAVEATVKAVLESSSSGNGGVDLGLMFDTDVDRSGIVDASGKGINRNRYIALMSAITLRDHPGGVIVTDSCTSNGLADFIKEKGGVHFRYKKGYKNIINKGIELNTSGGVNCPLMMETSGHGAMKENYFLDDGAYSAMKVVIEAVKRRLEAQGGGAGGGGGGDISTLLADLKEPVEAMEIRVKILADDVRKEGEAVTAAFHDWVVSGAGGNSMWKLEDENYEGWRVVIDEGEGGGKGWLLLRPSLHDPDVVINVESEKKGGMKESLKHLLEFFKEKEGKFEISTKQVEDYVSS